MTLCEPAIHVKDLRFKPIGAKEDILKGVNLEVYPGELVLLLGPSGCGKSTLVRSFNGLIPHLVEGEVAGDVLIMGNNTRACPIYKLAQLVGMVFQNPDDQILSLKVVDEVAWGVENLGLSHEEVKARVEEFMELLEISSLKDRLTFAISGGQKQKVSIASNLAMRQDILVLDDPTTDLDPICKSEVIQTLAGLRDNHKTLIVIEHDLNDLIELADRVIIMEDGKVVIHGSTQEIFSHWYEEMLRMGINIPQHVEIAHMLYANGSQPELYPTMKRDVLIELERFMMDFMPLPAQPSSTSVTKANVVVSIRDLEFAYDPAKPVLRSLNVDIHEGEIVAVIGANGSGKSTLINNLVGLLRPTKGEIIINGHKISQTKVADLVKDIGYVFQNPDHQLFSNTVFDEVGFSLKARGVAKQELDQRINEIMDIMGLADQRDKHPFSLSRGQRQKLAVGTALIHNPSIILLDEPTTGQDRQSLIGLFELMLRLNEQGNTTIMVTHDMDIVASYASRVIVMADGRIVLDGPPGELFYDHYDYLRTLKLRPPTVIEYCHQLQHLGLPRFLTLKDLSEYISALRQVRIADSKGVPTP